MEVTEDHWKEKLNNLIERRKDWQHNDDNRKLDNVVRDYKLHLSKVYVGKSVLDVGCGSKFLESCLPKGVVYFGIDAFPIDESVYKGKIEDDETVRTFAKFYEIDTVCAFAMLDGCQNLDVAIDNMKTIARKNIVFLTGIDIEPDKYHTFKIEMDYLDTKFSDWRKTYCEQLMPKVFLIEFSR